MAGAASSRTRRWRVFAVPIAALAALAGQFIAMDAAALGVLQHPSAEQSAAGVRGILFGEPLLHPGLPAAAAFVEGSELLLYGDSGLRVSGVKAGIRTGFVSVVMAAARLSGGVGREHRFELTPAVHGAGRWAASVGLVYETAGIDGMKTARLLSVTGRSIVRLSDAVSVGGEVARYRVRGEPAAGADIALAFLFKPVDRAIVRGVLEVDRWSGARPLISTTLEASGSLRLTFGYDTAAESLEGALAVSLGGLTCAAGAQYHPVLGTRQGVTLSWQR